MPSVSIIREMNSAFFYYSADFDYGLISNSFLLPIIFEDRKKIFNNKIVINNYKFLIVWFSFEYADYFYSI